MIISRCHKILVLLGIITVGSPIDAMLKKATISWLPRACTFANKLPNTKHFPDNMVNKTQECDYKKKIQKLEAELISIQNEKADLIKFATSKEWQDTVLNAHALDQKISGKNEEIKLLKNGIKELKNKNQVLEVKATENDRRLKETENKHRHELEKVTQDNKNTMQKLQKLEEKQKQEDKKKQSWKAFFWSKCKEYAVVFTAGIAAAITSIIWLKKTESGKKVTQITESSTNLLRAQLPQQQLLNEITSIKSNKSEKSVFLRYILKNTDSKLYPYLNGAKLIPALVKADLLEGFKILLEKDAITGINFGKATKDNLTLVNGSQVLSARYAPCSYNPFVYLAYAPKEWTKALIDHYNTRKTEIDNINKRIGKNPIETLEGAAEILNRPIELSPELKLVAGKTVLDVFSEIEKKPTDELIALLKTTGAKTFAELEKDATAFLGRQPKTVLETYQGYIAKIKGRTPGAEPGK